MARQTVEKNTIADEAYRIACEAGLSAVSIRDVAATCGVSVGSIYNHYASKEDLLADVVARFWREAVEPTACKPEPHEDFVDYVEKVYGAMRDALARFRLDWLPEIRALSSRGVAVSVERERSVKLHMAAGFEQVLSDDTAADIGRLGGVSAGSLCVFVTDTMMHALADGAEECSELAGLLRASLYEGARR